MKYILLKGAMGSGKSTTMDAICRKLKPSVVQRLNAHAQTLEDFDTAKKMENGTFVLEVSGKIILVAAGSPTEQEYTITLLIDIVIRLKGRIDFALVSMRSYETKEGFDTIGELQQHGKCIQEVVITQIPGDYEHSAEWLGRVGSIIDTLVKNGLKIGEMVNA